MTIISAKDLVDLAGAAFPGGLWIHLMGDSLLRGVFVHAVSFLTIRSKHIKDIFDLSLPNDYYIPRYICCSARYSENGNGDIDQCSLQRKGADDSISLSNLVAGDILARRSRGQLPICVSFTFDSYLTAFRPTFDAFAATFAATGLRPTSMVLNPGIWLLLPGYQLDVLIEDLKLLQAACTALFNQEAVPGNDGGPGAPSFKASQLSCMLMTTAQTAYTALDTATFKHSRTHPNILGYNAAISATWLDGGMPLLDAGALSLHPAIINSIDKDKLHYGYNARPGDPDSSPANPFPALCWQMILHTHASNGTHPCELAPQNNPLAAIDKDHLRNLKGQRRLRGHAHAARRAAAVRARLEALEWA
jgi:hypothetical protein